MTASLSLHQRRRQPDPAELAGVVETAVDADFRSGVNAALMEGIESGKYFEIYDKWFGPKGELPYPMSAAVRQFMIYQVAPK